MTKVEQQFAFLQDVSLLIQKAVELGITLTAGELTRTQEQQDLYLAHGNTTVKHSRHQDKMAIDFNYFFPVFFFNYSFTFE